MSFYQSQVTLEKILKAFVLIPTPPGQSWTVCCFSGNLLRILICTSSHWTILGALTRPKALLSPLVVRQLLRQVLAKVGDSTLL